MLHVSLIMNSCLSDSLRGETGRTEELKMVKQIFLQRVRFLEDMLIGPIGSYFSRDLQFGRDARSQRSFENVKKIVTCAYSSVSDFHTDG